MSSQAGKPRRSSRFSSSDVLQMKVLADKEDPEGAQRKAELLDDDIYNRFVEENFSMHVECIEFST